MKLSSVLTDAEEMEFRQLASKGLSLGILGRFEEAIAVCDEVIARFADTEEAAIREQVVWAMGNGGKPWRTQSLRGGNCGL